MGLIADLDCPHVIPKLERSRISHQSGTRVVRPSTGITRDTPIVPRAVAVAVWGEACVFLGEELPAGWITCLTEKAETLYTHGANFRRRIRGGGNSGRDWLWAFMRHWLAALLQEHRPELYRQLPARYCVGEMPRG